MQGSGTEKGVYFRTFEELFALKRERQQDCEYVITISMLEIYMDSIQDILREKGSKATPLKVVRGATGNEVQGLT